MNTLNRCSNNLIICDDFNFDFFKIDTDSKVTNFYDTTSTYLLTLLIAETTRITERSQTLIDNIFVSKPYSKIAGIFTFDKSDHYPIFAIFKIFFEHDNMKETVEYRVINDDTLASFSENLSEHDLSDLVTGLDLDASIVEVDSLSLRE